MTTVNNAFPYFPEAGTNGYIYIGAANQDAQTNPITVYRDAALTLPWAQPIRTLNGYPAYQGAQAEIYTAASSWSITVKNANQQVVSRDTLVTGGANGISYTFPGTGAVTTTVGDKLDGIPDPFDFGVSETGDSTAEFQAWLDACVAAGVAPYSSRRLIVTISDTIKMPILAISANSSGFDLTNIILSYNGTRDRPAFKVVGDSGGGNVARCRMVLPRVRAAGALQWPGTYLTNDIGILLELIHRSPEIVVQEVSGFTKGVEFRNSSYNTVLVGDLIDNKYAEVVSTKGSVVALEFSNENLFIGGRRGCSSAANLLGDAYGTLLMWDEVSSYRGQNNNKWESACYEMGVPDGATYRVPIYFKGVGAFNTWGDTRVESCKGPTAIFDGGGANYAYNNTVGVSFNSSSNTNQINGLLQVNDAAGNIYQGPGAKENTWRSPDLKTLLSSAGGADSPYIRGPVFIMDTTASTPVRSTSIASRVVSNTDALQLNGAAALVAIDTTRIKTWRATATALSGFAGRPIMLCLDSAGARLTGDAVDATWGNEPYCKLPGQAIVTITGFGGGYSGSGSDGVVDLIFTVREEVKTVYVGWASGTNNLAIRQFEVTGYSEPENGSTGANTTGGVAAFVPLVDDGSVRLASAKPDTAGTHGYYSKGQKVYSSAVAAAATDGWPCSTAGWLAPAWAINTAYTVPGHVVINGGNAYKLVTAGTSAGAGGPSGTGTGIADGTCVWDYVGVKAVFVTSAVTT